MICCPRRFGKTFCVAVYVACRTLAVPNSQVVIFSPGKRQSILMMELIRSHLRYLKHEYGIDFEVIPGKNNNEVLGISVNGNVRLITGLPASEDTVRGIGGNLIVCEELASMPKQFFTKVTLPVTGPKGTSLICISTIKSGEESGEEHWFTTLLNMTYPDGRPFFNTFKILLACPDCISKGIAEKCTHKQQDLPFWQTAVKQARLQSIFAALGEEDSAKQELLGITKNIIRPMINSAKVQNMFNVYKNPLITPEDLSEDPRMIFVMIDPSNGGDKSRTSLISLIHSRGQFVIVGGESIANKYIEEYLPFIIQHVENLFNLPRLKGATVIVGIENNTVGPARYIKDGLEKLKQDKGLNIIILKKEGTEITQTDLPGSAGSSSGKFGLRTSGRGQQENMKEEMSYLLKDMIESEMIRFYRDFLIVKGDETDPIKMYKLTLQEELRVYAMRIRHPKDASDTAKAIRSYGGKYTGKPDDDAIVLGLGLYWFTRFISDPSIRITPH